MENLFHEKNYFPLPCNSSSRFFCSSCSVNKSVQAKTYVLSTAIFASRHKTSLTPANKTTKCSRTLLHGSIHSASWEERLKQKAEVMLARTALMVRWGQFYNLGGAGPLHIPCSQELPCLFIEREMLRPAVLHSFSWVHKSGPSRSKACGHKHFCLLCFFCI